MAKEERAFTDKHWDLMLDGSCKGAKWPPKGGFGPGQKPGEISFTLLCQHEEMADGKKSWYQSLSFNDFNRVLAGLEQLALNIDSGETVLEYKFRYFKDGKMNFSGTNLLIGRAANGVCYMSWRNKKIPKVGFWFRGTDSKMLLCNKDGQDEDPRIDSRDCVLAKVAHWRARYSEWAADCIVKDDYAGGGNSGGGNSSSNNQKSNDDEPDFDDDVPF